jgi:glycosyltransferase involved in cell wall biosynthesis
MLHFGDFLRDQRIIKPQRFIQRPLVSVIMPTYCRAHDGLLSRAIRSVLTQTLSDLEFIIVDDGSIDGSEDLIRDFQKQDDRILYIRHEANSGLPALRADEGILLGQADYVAVQTDDDEWLGPFLDTVLREAAARNKPVVHCQAEWILEGKVYQSRFPMVQPTYSSLIQGNKIASNSVLVHRAILQEIGLYDPHVIMRRWTDWDLWLRAARQVTPWMVPEVLVRVHSGLPDSMGVRSPQIEYEDFMLLATALSRNTCLKSGNIRDYEVASLAGFGDLLPSGAVSSLYHSIVYPWITQHEEQLANLGVPPEEATRVKQQIAKCSPSTNGTTDIVLAEADSDRPISCKEGMSTKKRTPSAIAGTRRLAVKVLQPFPALMRLAQASYRSFCSVIVAFKTALRDQDDVFDTLPPEFQRIKDNPLMLSHRKDGFVLNRSCDLREVPFLPYKIRVKDGGLRAILLALAGEGSRPRGVVIIDAASENNQVVAYVRMPMSFIDSGKPAEFFFEPPLKAGEYCIRIFGKNLSVPVYVLEFRKHRLIRRLFCAPKLYE